MLDDGSYHTAIYTYVGSACAIMLLLGLWLGRHWRASWVVLVVLLAGALLLTPTYPESGGTIAPALVVAAFEFMTNGYEAAAGAIRSLAMMCGGAVLLSLLLGLTVLRRKRSAPDGVEPGAEGGAAPPTKGATEGAAA